MKDSTSRILYLNKIKLLSHHWKRDSNYRHASLTALPVSGSQTELQHLLWEKQCLTLIKTTLFHTAGSLSKCVSKHLYILHSPHTGGPEYMSGIVTSHHMHRRCLQHLRLPNSDCNGGSGNKPSLHKTIITDFNWRCVVENCI